jgi:hypothetical protein
MKDILGINLLGSHSPSPGHLMLIDTAEKLTHTHTHTHTVMKHYFFVISQPLIYGPCPCLLGIPSWCQR